MTNTTALTETAAALQEYVCRAYRLETFLSVVFVEAENPQKAMEKLKEMEQDGELDYEDYCEGEPAYEFVLETPQGELCEERPEYSVHGQQRRIEELKEALTQAVAALNTAPRFAVPHLDTDSYGIAALCDRALASAG